MIELLGGGRTLEQRLWAHAAAIISPLKTFVTSRSEEELIADPWEEYLRHRFPRYLSHKATGEPIPFAEYHKEFWEWVFAIRLGIKPAHPFIAIWPRGGAKSTNAEMACCSVADRRVRRYGWYCSASQDQADDHVQNVAAMLESPDISIRNPELSERSVGKFGHSRGWRRNRLRTRSGFTLDAVGFDTAARGVKLDEDRPDFIVFDDIDKDNESLALVEKKINLLTRKLIPAGSQDVAFLVVQNLVHNHSIMSRLQDGRADFLVNRKISGPHPAIRGMKWKVEGERTVITGGSPTWTGLDIDECQKKMDDMGFTAFLAECQHDRTAQSGTLLADVWFPSIHMIKPFKIPKSWTIDRSFDYGYSAPFSVGWWAESDGSPVLDEDGRPVIRVPAGTLFRIHEWYGWNGKPNVGIKMAAKEIGRQILKIEIDRPELKGRVKKGPADPAIWDGTNGNCVATDMASVGCTWEQADNRPGSRVNGARIFRTRLIASTRNPVETPALYVFDHCLQFMRTIPAVPKDPGNPDDAFTESEDHIYDEARYRLSWKRAAITSSSFSV